MSLYDRAITGIHFEATSECNARCPQCSRTYHQSLETHPLLDIRHWDANDLKRVLSDRLFDHLDNVLVNGNYGDILLHPNPRAILSVFSERNVRMDINTNGSSRGPEFWKWLATQPKTHVFFAIDGLADTHHLYRRKTDFQKILINARDFIEAGGRATWVMNVFKHNKHQVEESQMLAKELGFADFVSRPSTRFSGKKMSIVDENFQHSYYLEPSYQELTEIHSLATDHYVRGLGNFNGVFVRHDGEYLNAQKANVACRVARDSSVYLGYDGRMWPCCWTASGFEGHLKSILGNSVYEIYEDAYREDPDFNNVAKYSPTEVFEKLAGFQRIADSMTTEKPCTSCYFACRTDSYYYAQEKIEEKTTF